MDNLPEALKPISWLAGRWISQDGKGFYPTITGFSYHDVMEFTCIGQPMFNFSSSSSHAETKKPMHQERGFLRIKPGTSELALVVSHNFGLTSIEEGTSDAEAKEIRLKSTSLARISFSKPPKVVSIERRIKMLSPDSLEVVTSMATDKTDMTEHLRAVYTKKQ